MASESAPAETGRARRGATAPGGPLAAMGHRDFRVLIMSTMALQVGSWVQTIGLGWLVFHDLGGSATSLGLIALLRGSSLLLLAPVSGYLGGRLERKRQLMFYTTGSATIAATLAVLIQTDNIALWMVYCTSVASGAVEAMAQPIRQLLVFDSVEGEDLTNAVALNSLGANAMRVIGPAIGGALIGAVGTQGAFQVQALCLVTAVVLTSRLRIRRGTRDIATAGMFRSIGGGFAYVVRDRRMLTIVCMGALPSMMVYPYVSFLPVFASDVLHNDETAYGYLAAAVGLGSLAGGALVAFTAGRGPMGQRMLWSLLFYAAAVGGFALMQNLWAAVAMLTVAGAFHSVYSALNASLMQLKADPEYRSRVLSLLTMMGGLTPFAALLMGRMIDAWGPQHVVAAWMALAVVLTAGVIAGSRELRRV